MPTVTKHTSNNLVTVSYPVHEAKQVVDAVIASAEAEPEVQLKNSTAETEIDWSKVPEGTLIYVKDRLCEDWYKREFIRYNPDSVFSFVCKCLDNEDAIAWQRAKLINE